LNASIIIVQHVPPIIDAAIANKLDSLSAMDVSLSSDGTELKNSNVYMAKADSHLTLMHNNTIKLVTGDKVNFCMPSVDVTMKSLSKHNTSKIVGVVLTGLGCDGAAGISHIKQLGGVTIAQDERSSAIYGMPRAAYETGDVDFVLHERNICSKLVEIVSTS